MSVSASFLDFVLEQLEGVRGVTSRRMFGGVGLYAGETFFAVLDDDTLLFKVDDESVAEYRRAGARPFQPYKDRPEVSMRYWTVPVAVLEDRDELARWARRAVMAGEKTARTGKPDVKGRKPERRQAKAPVRRKKPAATRRRRARR